MFIKLLPLKSDFVFKLVFGDQRRVGLLTAFLQAVLDLPKEEYEKVTIIDPNVKKEYYDDKFGVLDVKIQTKTGNIIDVEIQVAPIVPLRKRISFYQAKMLLEQIGEGEDYSEIKKVISIVITDYVLIPGSAAYHHRFRFYDAENRVELTDTQEIHTLELPKLPTESDATELFDWMKLIGTKSEEDYNMLAQQKPEFERVVALVKQYSADELTRAQHEQRELWRMDHAASMKLATKQGLEAGHAKGLTEGMTQGIAKGIAKGMEKGVEKGRTEGRAEEKLFIARSMKAKGMQTSLIIELTGLSEAEIDNVS